MTVSDKGNYTFVVKDSLCFAENIQGMSKRNFFVYIIIIGLRILNKKEEISKKLGSHVFLLRFHRIKRLKLNCST